MATPRSNTAPQRAIDKYWRTMATPDIRSISVARDVTLAAYDWTEPGASGVPFVLVHGLASNARLWDGVARHLAADGHRVVAIDQRGHGHSSKPDDGYGMGTVANDLCRVIEDLGWDRPVVVGQSWGGNVVIELAARRPGVTAGVACIDGGFIDLRRRFPDWEECARVMRPPALIGTAASRIEASMRAAHPDWPPDGVDGAMANFEIRADGTIAPWLTLDRHLAILRGMWEHDPIERFAHIVEPVLWLPADSGDVAWTANKRTALDAAVAALKQSRVVWFSPADHDVHAQHPERVANVLHDATEDGFFGHSAAKAEA